MTTSLMSNSELIKYSFPDASWYTNRKNILSSVHCVPVWDWLARGLIDWLPLAFIQASSSAPDPLIQPGLGSDPHPLKLSTHLKIFMNEILIFVFGFDIDLYAAWWVFCMEECRKAGSNSEQAELQSLPPVLILTLLGFELGFHVMF